MRRNTTIMTLLAASLMLARAEAGPRRPEGWVGKLPHEREGASAVTPAEDEVQPEPSGELAPAKTPEASSAHAISEPAAADIDDVAGEGEPYSESPEVIVAYAVPPPHITEQTQVAEVSGAGPSRLPLAPEEEPGAADGELKAPDREGRGSSSGLSGSRSWTRRGGYRAELDIVGLAGRPGVKFDLATLAGTERWSYLDDQMVPIYTEYGLETTIQLDASSLPIKDVGCVLCITPKDQEREAPFWVDWTPDGKIVVHALEITQLDEGECLANPDDCGLRMTNLHVETRRGIQTFYLIEVTGLVDGDGRPYPRTEVHRVLPRPGDRERERVTEETLERRVWSIADGIRTQYQVELQKASETILEQKVREHYEAYGDFEVEEKSRRGRFITILSAVGLGDRILLKVRVPGDVPLGRPVVSVETGAAQKVLLAKGAIETSEVIVDGEPYIDLTLAVEGYVLRPGERLAVSIRDQEKGRDMKASAGRIKS